MTVKIKIADLPQVTIELNARKTLDGNIMIFDHEDIDIVVMAKEKKILSFAKDAMTDKVYDAQDRLYKFLRKKGVIDNATVQGGNIYGSIEAKLLESVNEKVNPLEVALFSIDKFISEEKPYFYSELEREQDEVDLLTSPDAEDSTELGEVPHESEKGSLVPGWVRGPYGMTSYYRY
jgi:hypothetical protein|tara:strand:+ start:7833 stop:8363 length:531 start_codon:yes stop_codon:yes gene_type:complete